MLRQFGSKIGAVLLLPQVARHFGPVQQANIGGSQSHIAAHRAAIDQGNRHRAVRERLLPYLAMPQSLHAAGRFAKRVLIHGQYFAIPQNGGVQTISTPYDERISELGTKLGGSYVAYGGGAGEAGVRYRLEAAQNVDMVEKQVTFSAKAEARAQRSLNKAINPKAYIGDLLQDIENGTTKLESVKEEDLPSDLSGLSSADRVKEIDRRLAERREIRQQILELSKQRAEYIAGEQKKRNGGQQNSFDLAVSAALKEQMVRKQ